MVYGTVAHMQQLLHPPAMHMRDEKTAPDRARNVMVSGWNFCSRPTCTKPTQ